MPPCHGGGRGFESRPVRKRPFSNDGPFDFYEYCNMYFVYIIESEVDGEYYKGFTTNYLKRLEQHNNGESNYTKTKIPWKLIFVIILPKFETRGLVNNFH